MSVVLNEGTAAVTPARDGVHTTLSVAGRADLAGPTRARFDRLRRSLLQVFLFGVFGLGGAVMTLVVAPGLVVLIRNPRRRSAIARRCVQYLLWAFTSAMHALRLIRLHIDGREFLQHRGVLIVANHPTLIDAFFLLARVDQLNPIAKRALLSNPFTSGAIRAADYLVNDEGPVLVEACRERLAAGESLLLFPEGTRTAADGRTHFRRGAAQVAVRCGSPVVPVIVAVSERFLTRSTHWWLAPTASPTVRIRVLAPIDPSPFVAASAGPALAARRLTEHLQQIYSKELGSRESV